MARAWVSLVPACIALAICARTADGQAAKNADAKKPEAPKLDVKVTLRFSVDELDPKNPGDSFVECVVHNRTDRAVQVPISYDGGFEKQTMVLYSDDPYFQRLRLVVWAGDKKRTSVRLEPGKEQTVFKAPLKEVLVLDPAAHKALKPTERRYYWTWQA